MTANTGLTTAIGLYGGVLEIAGGSNGVGASADVTLSVQSSLGSPGVYWTKSGSGGSGGFSAFGANASVSLGAATPTALQWNNVHL